MTKSENVVCLNWFLFARCFGVDSQLPRGQYPGDVIHLPLCLPRNSKPFRQALRICPAHKQPQNCGGKRTSLLPSAHSDRRQRWDVIVWKMKLHSKYMSKN